MTNDINVPLIVEAVNERHYLVLVAKETIARDSQNIWNRSLCTRSESPELSSPTQVIGAPFLSAALGGGQLPVSLNLMSVAAVLGWNV